jgi:hypothetical protein
MPASNEPQRDMPNQSGVRIEPWCKGDFRSSRSYWATPQ